MHGTFNENVQMNEFQNYDCKEVPDQQPCVPKKVDNFVQMLFNFEIRYVNKLCF